AAYGIGIKGKGAALVNRVRVLHVGDSGTRAYAETYTGVFVPSRGSHVVGPAAGGLVTDLTTAAAANFGGNPTAGSTTVLGGGANAEVRFDGVPAFTMRAFATSGFVDLGGGIAQKLTLSGGVLAGTVVSSLPFSLTDAYVVVGGTATAVGIVRPGADTQLAARGISYESQANSSYNGAGVASQIFPGMFSSSDRDQQRRGHVVEALFPNTPAGDPGPVLIGWAGDSPGPLQVDGQPTPSTDLTLVVVPLHPAVAAGTIGSGDLAMRLVDLPSAAANQFPYFYLSANSTARFEAALPAARWTDLRVRISHQSAFFGGFGTPGCPTGSIPQGTGVFVQAPRSGCIAPATVEVFNFAKDAWTAAGQTGTTGTTDSVDLGPGADLVSPAGVVEVRLRAGNGDTQAIASVTLAGGSAS
ncbi:MAG TPA: hypothetical protein VG245_04750, partial [Candidatus Dormibacteraeota bacterium]|nr:hypothetical protein [Candidatus Dormibacteraeota bacterium]